MRLTPEHCAIAAIYAAAIIAGLYAYAGVH